MRIALLFFTVLFSLAVSAQSLPDNYALVGAKIYLSPEAAPIEEGTVLVRAGKIIAAGPSQKIKVPAGIQTIDCHGKVLTSAFWNCHVHFIEAKWMTAATAPAEQLNSQLADMLTSHGFAHVFDIAELEFPHLLSLRQRINTGELKGPVIYCVGIPFTPPNGSPFYILPAKLPEIGDPQEAAIHVQHQIDSGADGIKIWSASPAHNQVVNMPLEIAKAAVAVAHKQGLPVFAHPTDNDGVNIAVDAGVDILAHTSPDGISGERPLWSDTLIKKMLAHHMAVIPTLKLWTWELGRQASMPVDEAIHNALEVTAQKQLAQYQQAGGQILFGTDVGYMADYSTDLEFQLMGTAGLDYRQILASLTTAPANRFHQDSHTGHIAAGMDADLVLLDADPATDVKSFAKVNTTWLRGRIIYTKN